MSIFGHLGHPILDFNDSGSLSSANLLGNDIGVEQAQALLKIKEAKPGLTTLCGLSGDETELDLSGKGLGPGCAVLLAPEMEANWSLSRMTFCGNGGLGGREGDVVTIDTTMTEADFSGKKLGAAGAQILAAFMSTKLFEAKGSLSSANLLDNWIGVEQAQALLKIKDAKPGLTTLCGLSGDETELDLSGNLSPGCAILLAPEVEANRSLSKLKMNMYDLPVQEIKTATELDLSGKGLSHLDGIVIAALIKVQTITQNSLGD
jgi:hypothetical protein